MLAALRSDLNTPAALGALFTAINTFDVRRATRADALALDAVKAVLGFDRKDDPQALVPPEVRELAERRWSAKLARDFPTADRLRGELAAAGWSMLDGKAGFQLERSKKA